MEGITLVIPVKNEEKSLGPLIASIRAQTLAPDEVIFVDGGSTDRTKEIISAGTGRGAARIRLIETAGAYPGAARNMGVDESVTDRIAFTDGGITLDACWLEELDRAMRAGRGGVEAVYGRYEPVTDSFLKRCGMIAFVPAREKKGGVLFRTDFIASSLFRKKTIQSAGGFPGFRAAEDRIFMENVRGSGARIAYTDRAVVYWEIPGTAGGVFRRSREFSMHDIIAGRAKDWHVSVLSVYAATLILAAGGVCVSSGFFRLALLLWAVRLARIFYRKRADLTPAMLLNPVYAAGIIFLILVTDMGLICGTFNYIFRHYVKTE
ncbi:MAG: glycosyltransferase [Candidatus Omnitrophota bacterium]